MANNQITPFQLTDQFTMDNFNQRINETNTSLQNKIDGIESTDYPGCYYRMNGSVVEWVNPPMLPGVEYRTTKRIDKKPVFTRRISFNGLDASGAKVIFIGTDEAKAAWIVYAVATDPDDTASEGNFISIPHHNDITIGILGRWISIKWTDDYSKYTYGTIVVEYVKEAI